MYTVTRSQLLFSMTTLVGDASYCCARVPTPAEAHADILAAPTMIDAATRCLLSCARRRARVAHGRIGSQRVMTGTARASTNERRATIAYGRLALTVVLALYAIPLMRHPESGGLLGGIDLAIHGTGHLVFGIFGEVIGVAGGTLFQLIVPVTYVLYFAKRGDRHAATVPLWWVAQNLWNISVYVRDARVQELPLVGGGEHDWAYLLGRFGLLAHDQGIGRGVHAFGTLLCIAAVATGIKF